MEGCSPIVHYVDKHFDDRGSVYCPLDNLQEKKIERTYVISNFSKGLIRAWHGHRLGFTGMHVIRGAAKLIARNMDDLDSMMTATLSEEKPGVFWIPPGYYNGAMSLTNDTKVLVYSTHTFKGVKGDDHRMMLSKADRALFKVTDR